MDGWPARKQAFQIAPCFSSAALTNTVLLFFSTVGALKLTFEAMATKRTLAQMFAEFSALPYEPYSPVLDQLFELLRAVNRKREQAGLLPLKGRPIRTRRKIFLPFEDVPDGRSLYPNLESEPMPLVDS